MYSIITVSEGNAPHLQQFETHVEADRAFKAVNLDKWAQAVHFYLGEKLIGSRYLTDDGELHRRGEQTNTSQHPTWRQGFNP